jgi:hypothetical protein
LTESRRDRNQRPAGSGTRPIEQGSSPPSDTREWNSSHQQEPLPVGRFLFQTRLLAAELGYRTRCEACRAGWVQSSGRACLAWCGPYGSGRSHPGSLKWSMSSCGANWNRRSRNGSEHSERDGNANHGAGRSWGRRRPPRAPRELARWHGPCAEGERAAFPGATSLVAFRTNRRPAGYSFAAPNQRPPRLPRLAAAGR